MLLRDGVTHHPKVLAAGPEASWLWVAAIDYSRQHLTDGHVSTAVLPTLGVFRTPLNKLIQRLVEAGLFIPENSGYTVHDFLEHNDSREAVLEKRRADAERKKGNAHARPSRVRQESARSPSGIHAEQNTLARARVRVGVGTGTGSGTQTEIPETFTRFWDAYPRHVGKPKALAAFLALQVDDALLERLLAALAEQVTWPQWTKDAGAYIPHPATWLHQRRWEDEPPRVRPARASLPYRSQADWVCPHEPHCGSRSGCERQQQLEAARAEVPA